MDIKNARTVTTREDRGTVVHLKDECGVRMFEDAEETKPVTITVVGSYSARSRRSLEAAREAVAARKLDLDDAVEFNVEVLAGCITDWEGFTADGQPFPYTRENARVLLREVQWIREQVTIAHNNHALFSTAS